MYLVAAHYPWIFSHLAIYAPDVHLARQAYELVRDSTGSASHGTVTLHIGIEVRWVNIDHGSLRLRRE